jgi:hypothetical protein
MTHPPVSAMSTDGKDPKLEAASRSVKSATNKLNLMVSAHCQPTSTLSASGD